MNDYISPDIDQDELYETTKQIMDLADEISLMIARLPQYKEYFDLKSKITISESKSELLHGFIQVSESLAKKEEMSIDIEPWEKEQFTEIAGKIAKDDELCEFIRLQSEYLKIIGEVFQEFSKEGVLEN